MVASMASYGSFKPFVPWRERELPLDWKAEFGRKAPLRVEIGYGNGEYLAKCAQQDPASDYVGIEMTWGSTWRLLRTTNRLGLSNVRNLWEDANAAMDWCFSEKTVESIAALYPCPWPKKRHAKFRLFQVPFMKLCNSRLVDGGQMVVVTDSPDYRDQMVEELQTEVTGLELTVHTIGPGLNTKYERKWQEGGRQEFYRLVFDKVSHQSHSYPERYPMKHHLAQEFNPEAFKPQGEVDGYSIEFKLFLFDQKQQMGMQEVFTMEDGLEQHFWVRIKKQENGWKIAPAGGPSLLPIKSAQRALDLIKIAAEA